MSTSKALFAVGQVVHHKRFDYRGVVIDVDAEFHGTEDWYTQMASSKPPKDNPWYHVLVDESELRTYVAQRNLEPDDTGEPVRHPDVRMHFSGMTDDGYTIRRLDN
ncbi:MAG: heat shock protein HspQ [Rhodospirillaceae bacterium]|jgi:heat shock protein HspQ|nr:heat shock protein HspQ [Rhodospirillaceae bacterium]MBT7953956.1 heat shock protein HspQ [Rhodospirillaceae bacterium]